MTPDRNTEITRRIDERFDQFSADELRSADPNALMFGLAWAPPLTAEERDLVRSYSQAKLTSIRQQLEVDSGKPAPNLG